jgi:hypothetical protein
MQRINQNLKRKKKKLILLLLDERMTAHWVKRSRFFSKGKFTDTNYNVVDHESNPSHYQLSANIIVIPRRITSYKALQHWLTNLLHHLI